MTISAVQRSHILLHNFESGPRWHKSEIGRVTIESASGRTAVLVELPGMSLYVISPEEAHAMGSALIAHAEECGYDCDTGEVLAEADFGT